MVLVGLTRVKDLAHCRTMPLLPGKNYDHLYKLRADPVMLAWVSVFLDPQLSAKDLGTWSDIRAQQALARLKDTEVSDSISYSHPF